LHSIDDRADQQLPSLSPGFGRRINPALVTS
jgi:hypothetical protein